MIDNLAEATRLLNATQLMLLGKDNQPISDLYYALQIAVGAIEELQECREADRWIPVTERLPEDTEDVLVYDGQDMFVAWCGSYNRWHSSDDKLDKNTPITHWKPLPKAPESEAKNETDN